jgi:hypothetical protein
MIQKRLWLVLICSAIFLAGFWLSWRTCNGSWINSSGTLIVIAGIFLEGWKLLTTKRADDMPMWGTQESHTAIRVALFIVIVGTLVQGYGDYLLGLLRTCPDDRFRKLLASFGVVDN